MFNDLFDKYLIISDFIICAKSVHGTLSHTSLINGHSVANNSAYKCCRDDIVITNVKSVCIYNQQNQEN